MRLRQLTVPLSRTIEAHQSISTKQASHGVQRAKRLLVAVTTAVALTTASIAPAWAQAIPLIRDSEIEALVGDYARPIFRAAGLGAQNIAIRIVRHDSFNAFVVDGRNVFIHTGLLTQATTPNEVIGVLAHETGHITGGHLAALRARIARDQTKALLVSILGIGAMIAGARSGSESGRELGGLGQGVMLGGNEVLMRGILAERRAQESAADQAALKFLNATRQSGRGLLTTFERFAEQEFASEQNMDPFVRSHPVATTRLNQLRDLAPRTPHVNAVDPPALQLRHEMMKAKISGYLDRPQIVANKYPRSDNSLPARYARTIAANCSGRCDNAIGLVDELINADPRNPYFVELKGNLLYQSGKPRQAVPYLRKALQMAGGTPPMLLVNLAQALLNSEIPGSVETALQHLRQASIIDPDFAGTHRLMSTAFGKLGQQPQAELAAAQAHFIDGNIDQAKSFARRAQAGLKKGQPEWIRAEDIVTYKDTQR